LLQQVLIKANYWSKNAAINLNERQRKVVNKLLDGFEGKLTSDKWSKLTNCSKDTAIRDINDLISKELIQKEAAGGRSTSYVLKLEY
jgi:Fic family protein